MRHFFNLFTHNAYWFVGTLVVIGILFFIGWRTLYPIESARVINTFLQDVWTLAKYVLTLVIIYFGVRIMFKKSFPKNKGSH